MQGVIGNHEAMASGTAPYVCMAMSKVNEGVADQESDMQVAEIPCGAVHQMAHDENYSITSMVPAVAGGACDETAAPDAYATD